MKSAIFVLAALTCLPSLVRADIMAITSIDPAAGATPTVADIGDWVLGWTFETDSAMEVTKLGFYDFGEDGVLAANTQVGIWRYSDSSLITSAQIATNGTASGGFIWSEALPTTAALEAGTKYSIGFKTIPGGGEAYLYRNTSALMADGITFLGNAAYLDPGFSMPTDYALAGTGFVGPNFMAVPEPATMCLIAAGAVGLIRRRK